MNWNSVVKLSHRAKIILDFSGTIINDIIATWNAFNYLLVRRGRISVSLMEFCEQFELPYWNFLIKRGLTETESKSREVVKEIEHTYLENADQITPFPDTRAALACLEAMEIPLAIASSSTRAMIETQLDRFGLRHHFKAIVSYEDSQRPKPDPEPLLIAHMRTGTKFEKCFYFGDMAEDAIAAHRAGFFSVSLDRTGSFNTKTRLETSGTDYRARDLWDAIWYAAQCAEGLQAPRQILRSRIRQRAL